MAICNSVPYQSWTKWRRMVSFTLQPLFPWRRNRGTHWTRPWLGPKPSLKVVHKI